MATRPDPAPGIRPLGLGVRLLLRTAGAIALVAGLLLLLFPGPAGQRFAFPIEPALTASFLGASYLAAVPLAWLSARRGAWADGAVAVAGTLVFTVATGIVTWLHRAHLNLGEPAAWIWVSVYAVFPPSLAVAWLLQRRAAGGDPPVRAPTPRAVQGSLAIGATVLLPLGAALVFYPAQAMVVWPWVLTPPGAAYRTESGTSLEPYIGCWLLGAGLASLVAARTPDLVRLRPLFMSAGAFGAMQILVLGSAGAEIRWSDPRVVVYAAALILCVIWGVWGLLISSRRPALASGGAKSDNPGRTDPPDPREPS